jgi:hypothetical protein
MEELREAKQYEHSAKTLSIEKNSLQNAMAKLKLQFEQKVERETEEEFAKKTKELEKGVLNEQVLELREENAQLKETDNSKIQANLKKAQDEKKVL